MYSADEARDAQRAGPGLVDGLLLLREFSHGGKFRILTVVDAFTRAKRWPCMLGIGLHRASVVDVLNRLARHHGAPKAIFVDNGSEFTGRS